MMNDLHLDPTSVANIKNFQNVNGPYSQPSLGFGGFDQQMGLEKNGNKATGKGRGQGSAYGGGMGGGQGQGHEVGDAHGHGDASTTTAGASPSAHGMSPMGLSGNGVEGEGQLNLNGFPDLRFGMHPDQSELEVRATKGENNPNR